MHIGAVYPQIELQGDPAALDRIGRSVEQLGFHHLLMYDHVVGAVREGRDPPLGGVVPYSDKEPFHDPLVAFAYLAGVTRSLQFVTGVLILPQRQTALVAQQVADIDLLSGGRLSLGVGTGWNYVEYDVLNEEFTSRGKRMTEQIEVLRLLWGEPLVSFDGDFHHIDRANINPRPRRRIPILCGGYSEPAYRRAAQHGDGFIFGGSTEAALAQWSRVQALLRQTNRSVTDFQAYYLVMNDAAAGVDVADAADAVRRWEDAGGTHASVVSMGRGYMSDEQHLEYFQAVQARLSKR